MGYRNHPADRHVQDLLEALEELLAVPELTFFDPKPFDETLEAIARARVVRSAVLDELAALAPST